MSEGAPVPGAIGSVGPMVTNGGLGVLASNAAFVDAWHAVARSVEVTRSAASSVRVLERDLVLWRAPDDTAVAAPDRCPPRQAPLSGGTVEGGCLSCPYHGWTFAADGRCVR